MKTSNQIKEELNQFCGTEHYYKNLFGIVYTDGIRFLAEECQCYWLIDLVASYQSDSKVKLEEFQVYKLTVNSDHSAVVEITDGNYNIITKQEIEFTDFPLDEITLWFTNNVLYLQSEH
jgi:hypothetical protein